MFSPFSEGLQDLLTSAQQLVNGEKLDKNINYVYRGVPGKRANKLGQMRPTSLDTLFIKESEGWVMTSLDRQRMVVTKSIGL